MSETQERPADLLVDESRLSSAVEEVVSDSAVLDMHTHLFAPQFGTLNLSGIDELLTYHYLIAELFRAREIQPEAFWTLGRAEQADLIWETLFVNGTPLSEATRGVIAVLSAFGLDTRAADLREARAFFAAQDQDAHLARIFELAGVSSVVMTNDPLDEGEWRLWEAVGAVDPRFHAALRMDGMLNDWAVKWSALEARGIRVGEELTTATLGALRKFLDGVIERMRPLYLAVSLPDTFAYPEESVRGKLIEKIVLPICRDYRLPFALMIGVRRNVNPAIRLAGDGLGKADLGAVNHLCVENPDVRFLVTMLSRENQHELCVSARKFGNLMPFGCWWFLNNPSIIEEVTRERLELLGPSFIPQHSDARVLEQLIYKWRHSRRVISGALTETYRHLLRDGRAVTRSEIRRDVDRFLSGNFAACVGLKA
jgi:hypothetical protein